MIIAFDFSKPRPSKISHLYAIAMVAAGLFGSAAMAHADVFKCIGPSGAVSYQGAPCDKSETRGRIENADATDQRQGIYAPSEEEKAWVVMLTLTIKNNCDLAVPGFREKSATAWAQWRSRFSKEILKLEMNPAFQTEIDKAARQALNPRVKAELSAACTDEMIDRIGKAGLPPDPPDPRYASPQKTWVVFVDALRAADRKAAVACLTGNARKKYAPVLKERMSSALKEMANSIEAISPSAAYGQFQEFFIQRKDGKAGIVTFENAQGQWLITEM
jgi:hypothetical protein